MKSVKITEGGEEFSLDVGAWMWITVGDRSVRVEHKRSNLLSIKVFELGEEDTDAISEILVPINEDEEE